MYLSMYLVKYLGYLYSVTVASRGYSGVGILETTSNSTSCVVRSSPRMSEPSLSPQAG